MMYVQVRTNTIGVESVRNRASVTQTNYVKTSWRCIPLATVTTRPWPRYDGRWSVGQLNARQLQRRNDGGGGRSCVAPRPPWAERLTHKLMPVTCRWLGAGPPMSVTRLHRSSCGRNRRQAGLLISHRIVSYLQLRLLDSTTCIQSTSIVKFVR